MQVVMTPLGYTTLMQHDILQKKVIIGIAGGGVYTRRSRLATTSTSTMMYPACEDSEGDAVNRASFVTDCNEFTR